jgi:hypothetical protein
MEHMRTYHHGSSPERKTSGRLSSNFGVAAEFSGTLIHGDHAYVIP